MKKSTLAIVIASVVAGVLALAAIIVGVGYIAWSGLKVHPTSEEEKKLVLGAESFAGLELSVPRECEKYGTTRLIDGSREVSYELHCPQADIYVRSTAHVAPTQIEARQNFAVAIGTYRAGLAISRSKLTIEPRESLVTFGDQRYGALVTSDKKPAGNIFIVRQGRVVHAAMITGVYYDEPETVQGLFAPLLEESKRQFGPKQK